jgi:hypothetical protein
MGQNGCGDRVLSGLFGFDKKLVGIVGFAIYLRCLYYKIHTLDMVERG